jgi:hypothetical protein
MSGYGRVVAKIASRPRWFFRFALPGIALVALLAAIAVGAEAKTPPYGPGGDEPPTVALAASKGGPISPSLGNADSIGVLLQIQRAYRRASGVELTTRSGSSPPSRRFVLDLHDGKVTAEAFIGPAGLALVRRTVASPTFMRAAGSTCWRRLAKEDPRTLLNVGAPFPENGKVTSDNRQLLIETHDGFWGYLASHVVPSITFYKSFLTISYDQVSHDIGAIVVRAPDHRVLATQTVKRLAKVPTMPMTSPAC